MNTIDGLKICKNNTIKVKKIISEAIRSFKLEKPQLGKFVFVLVGSSGRGEMCYKSDIDYLIVYDESFSPKDVDLLIAKISDVLSRSYLNNEMSAFAVGNQDFIIDCGKYSFIDRLVLDDTLFVAGDEELYKSFKKAIDYSFGSLSQEDLDMTILNLLFIYRRFYQFPDFNSEEPNIKKGRGGIREIQNFIQIAKIRYKIKETDLTKTINKMKMIGVISTDEAKIFKQASEFIFGIRNQIHKMNKDENDVFTKKLQIKIAKDFGYSNKEDFMKTYREYGQNIRSILKRLKENLRKEINKRKGKIWTDNFKKAENPKQKQKIYNELFKENDDSIKLAIAWNCPYGHILKKILNHCLRKNNKNWNIMFALAHSIYSPPSIFKKLLEFKDGENAYRMIPREVADNKKVPIEILKNITYKKGFDNKTAERAQKNILSRQI